MQTALIAILSLATLTLLVLAAAQWRRRRRLARLAHELGLNFFSNDPYDLPRRYAAFTLMQAGHGAYADNVMFGRMGGWSLRAFDYRYEAGHGPHRLVRRHSVVAADAATALPAVLAWQEPDGRPDSPVAAPVALMGGHWRVAGNSDVGRRLAGCWRLEGGDPACIEARDELLLFSVPRRLEPRRFATYVRAAVECLDRLAPQDRQDGEDRQNRPADD